MNPSNIMLLHSFIVFVSTTCSGSFQKSMHEEFSTWVESTILRTAPFFDPVHPQLFETGTQHAHPKVLMIGDSINRQMVIDLCSLYASKPWDFCTPHLAYNKASLACAVCTTGNFSIGFVHIYGASLTMPYLHNIATDNFTNTELRVPLACDLFSLRVGSPHLVFFRTDIWNFGHAEQLVHQGAQYNQAQVIRRFVIETSGIFVWLQSRFPSSCVCTHTVPKIRTGVFLNQSIVRHESFSAGLRLAAVSSKTVLFDWALLLLPSDDRDFLRDKIHPNVQHARSFASLVMESARKWISLSSSHP